MKTREERELQLTRKKMDKIMKTQERSATEFIVNHKTICVAIMCITALEMMALWRGINGILLMIVIAVIAGAAGLTMPTPNILCKEVKKHE